MEPFEPMPPEEKPSQPNFSPATKTSAPGAELRRYVSEAREGTVGACLIGLFAFLYVVLGRIGLLIIGVVSGVVLHIAWERNFVGQSETLSGKRKQNETALEVAKRLLEWRDSQNEEELDGKSECRANIAMRMAAGQELNFSSFTPCISSALTELADAIIRDYVKYWYSPILDEETFPHTARQTLVGFIISLGDHLARKRPADTLLNFLTNATSVFIVFLNELCHALMTGDGPDLETSEAISLYLDRSNSSNLSNMASLEEQEKKFLAVADDLLQSFLDHKTYNCEPARVFLTQIVAGVMLPSVLRTISKPEWINTWIIHLLEEGEPELLNAIDAGVERATQKTEISSEVTRENEKMPSGIQGAQSSHSEWDFHAASETGINTSRDAMQAAMEEAKRLTAMIQAEETRKNADVGVAESASHISASETASPTLLVAGDLDSRAETTTTPLQDKPKDAFTSFDQIGPSYRAVPDNAISLAPLTLHQAKITVMDDGMPGDQNILKNKPHIEYLIQIEPSTSLHSGWMVARMYHELEPFHEYLYKIANVTGATTFSRRYQFLPSFKGKNKETYRQELEKYLNDALSHETIAESEGMKKFLDKDQGFRKSNNNKSALGFAAPVGDAFQTVGKGVLGGFNTATKGVAAGSQAMFEGVGGLFAGPRKQATPGNFTTSEKIVDQTEEHDKKRPSQPTSYSPGPSQILEQRKTEKSASASSPDQAMELRQVDVSDEKISGSSPSPVEVTGVSAINIDSTTPNIRDEGDTELSMPRPEQVPIGMPTVGSAVSEGEFLNQRPADVSRSVIGGTPENSILTPTTNDTHLPIAERCSISSSPPNSSNSQPLDESETRVAVELVFAAINELFTLSSVWNIRRTLLNAAKNYLLRPGNPSLLSIRELLQLKLLDANLTDEAISLYLQKLRQNSLPTEEELQAWPPIPAEEEKEGLRVKARRLLLAKGMPQALTSVMGATASSEALGRVFDCLQMERVGRGLMFAMLLQGMKTVTH